jgi:hypothetical protein
MTEPNKTNEGEEKGERQQRVTEGEKEEEEE